MRDITEFLSGLELNPNLGRVDAVVTYQDSCHLAHGQHIRQSPRQLLGAIPGLTFREMPGADICCGSAGIYNVVQTEMSMQILQHKMESVNATHRSEEHTSELQSLRQLVCRLLLENNNRHPMCHLHGCSDNSRFLQITYFHNS